MEKRLVAIGVAAVAAAIIAVGAAYAASGQATTASRGFDYGYGGMMGRSGYGVGPTMMGGGGSYQRGMMGAYGGMMGYGGAFHMGPQYMWEYLNATSAATNR